MSQGRKPPLVAIVLVNWNSKSDTLECLESVFRLRYPNFRVVICDNASSDGSLEAVAGWAAAGTVAPASAYFADLLSAQPRTAPVPCVRIDRSAAEGSSQPEDDSLPPLTLIDTGGNLGFAGGNNVGILFALRRLRADFVWLLNTDTVVDPDALDALVVRAQRDPAPGIVGSTLVFYWFPDKVQALGGARLVRKTMHITHIGDGSPRSAVPADGSAVEREMAYVVGASMLVSRPFLEQVGLMNVSYFLYYEELDWAERAAGRFTLGYAPASIVYHKVGGASRRVASLAAEHYMWSNRIRVAARFLPSHLGTILGAMAIEMLRAVVKGRFNAARAIASALWNWRRLSDEGAAMDIGGQLA